MAGIFQAIADHLRSSQQKIFIFVTPAKNDQLMVVCSSEPKGNEVIGLNFSFIGKPEELDDQLGESLASLTSSFDTLVESSRRLEEKAKQKIVENNAKAVQTMVKGASTPSADTSARRASPGVPATASSAAVTTAQPTASSSVDIADLDLDDLIG